MVMGYGYAGKAVIDTATAATLGGVIGLSQEVLLREEVDVPMANGFLSGTTTTPPFLMKQLGNFGSPSVIIGSIAGIAGLGLGLEGLYRSKIIKSTAMAAGALGYGASSLGGALFNGFLPASAWSNGVAKDPNRPIRSSVRITPRQPPASQNQVNRQAAQRVIGI